MRAGDCLFPPAEFPAQRSASWSDEMMCASWQNLPGDMSGRNSTSRNPRSVIGSADFGGPKISAECHAARSVLERWRLKSQRQQTAHATGNGRASARFLAPMLFKPTRASKPSLLLAGLHHLIFDFSRNRGFAAGLLERLFEGAPGEHGAFHALREFAHAFHQLQITELARVARVSFARHQIVKRA